MSAIKIKDEIMIAKGRAAIWKILTDINSWRLWSGVIDRAVIYGQLRSGTSFKCLADKWDFDCVIEDVVSEDRFYCRGKTIGLEAAFQWELSPAGEGTRVSLVAEIDGWMARYFGKRIRAGFEGAIFTWLSSLKNNAERRAVKAEAEKRSRMSGRYPKRKISLLRPFRLLQPDRRDQEYE